MSRLMVRTVIRTFLYPTVLLLILLLIYLYGKFVPALKKTLIQLMIYSWVKRTSRRPSGLSVRYHGRQVFIGHLCPRLFERICIWNISRGAVHRSWQTRTALLAWNAISFCFISSRSMPLTLFSLWTKRWSWSLHQTIDRTKSVADCGNFWRRSLEFFPVRALRGLPLPGRLLTVPVSLNFLNSLLTPCFVQLFLGNSSGNIFAVYPFKYELLSKSCPRR